jgi:hypothetical protein
MIELSIPQPGEESKNVKDLVFSILSAEYPLSIIELTNRIQRNYNISVTYQAVRKAIEGLLEQGVLLKQGKKYSVDKDWIFKLRSFFDQLLTRYDEGRSTNEFTVEPGKENYAVYTLPSLFELDVFWGDVLWYLTDHLTPQEDRNHVYVEYYAWWMLINLGRETKLVEHCVKKKVKVHMVLSRDLPLNRWAAKIYSDMGYRMKIAADRDSGEYIVINILGDTVLQIRYPAAIIKKVRSFFEKYSTTQDMSMKEITEIAHSPCEIKFIVFRNPTIARNLRETYLNKYFKKA